MNQEDVRRQAKPIISRITKIYRDLEKLRKQKEKRIQSAQKNFDKKSLPIRQEIDGLTKLLKRVQQSCNNHPPGWYGTCPDCGFSNDYEDGNCA